MHKKLRMCGRTSISFVYWDISGMVSGSRVYGNVEQDLCPGS